jgi:hypothetical protein
MPLPSGTKYNFKKFQKEHLHCIFCTAVFQAISIQSFKRAVALAKKINKRFFSSQNFVNRKGVIYEHKNKTIFFNFRKEMKVSL